MKRYQNCSRSGAFSRYSLAAAGLLIAFSSHSQEVVSPNLSPYSLAPYVLERNSVEATSRFPEGGTRAYRPWFEPGAWTGDLIQYIIEASGQRLLRDDIGGYPRDGVPDWRGNLHPDPWSARYAFPDFEAYSLGEESNPEAAWCKPEDPDYWKHRKIVTFSANSTRDFFWNNPNLTTAQRSAIDSGLAADDSLDDEAFASDLLNFIRGERRLERCAEEDVFRTRFSLLGAVINSRPVYIPPHGEGSERKPGIVVVGANAGMLHGFNSADGSELFAYVPSMILNRLSLVGSDLFRTYFVDGELRHQNTGTEYAPRNIVAGGLGAGGKGLFVLDVTNVTPTTGPTVMHELSGLNAPFIGGSYKPEIGHIFGRPVIARLPASPRYQDGWYVVSGNGFDSAANKAQLVLIPVDGTQPVFIDTDSSPSLPGSPPNGLSAPALVDTTGNGVADVAYAGDLRGRLWRFNLKAASATLIYDGGADHPITVESDVARHPSLDGYIVYFGTGRLLSATDIQTTTRGRIYGIWDKDWDNPSASAVVEDDLVRQKVETVTQTWDVAQEDTSCAAPPGLTSQSTVRLVTDQQDVNWTTDRGWWVELPRDGERLVKPARVRADRLQFTTTNPIDMLNSDPNVDPAAEAASPAGSWMMQLDLETGANPRLASKRRALFDLNKNCRLDTNDAVEITSGPNPGKYFPIGLSLGASNIAQPEFARVRFDPASNSVVDGVYINAVRFPSPSISAPGLVGPIDVMVDIPGGTAPLWHAYSSNDPDSPGRGGLYPEPAKLDFDVNPPRSFNDASGPIKPYLDGDGVGNRVDGHASGYNLIHGVNYIDIIRLEPRRDDYRLDVGTVFEDTDQSIKQINPRKAKQELYRATEAVPLNQKFIVMLANADLSPLSSIQIGCQIWPVYQYQTMMMQHLRKGTNAMVGRGDNLANLNDDSLIVQLGDFFEAGPEGEPVQRRCTSRPPGSPDDYMTIRIIPSFPNGMMNALQHTLPGCVNNTHLYDGPIKSGALTATREQLYAVDPHVTPNQEGNEYRWRNGALTLQLLRVDANNVADFLLQDRANLPIGVRKGNQSPQEGVTRGFGGAYAKGFVISGGKVEPYTGPENGMLYEATMFWHFGDLMRNRSRGAGQPTIPSCYAGATNSAEWEDLFNRGGSDQNFVNRYKALVDGFSTEDQQNYAIWMNNLANGTDVENSILKLQDLFQKATGKQGNTQFYIGDWHRLRHYVLASTRLNNELIPIDRGVNIDLQDAGTPVNVLDIERDLLPSLGPNYQPGRRSWIDLTPDE